MVLLLLKAKLIIYTHKSEIKRMLLGDRFQNVFILMNVFLGW